MAKTVAEVKKGGSSISDSHKTEKVRRSISPMNKRIAGSKHSACPPLRNLLGSGISREQSQKQPLCDVLEKALKHSRSDRVLQLGNRLGFNLTDSLPGHFENTPNLLERIGKPVG